MNRCRARGMGVFALVAWAALSGCADRSSALFIVANVQPNESCVVQADGVRLFGGTLDTAFASADPGNRGYIVYPVYQNQLIDRSGNAPLRADANGFVVTGAEVELLAADGSPLALPAGLPNPYTIVATDQTFIPSTEQGSDSLQSGALEIIPHQYILALDEVVQQAGSFTMLASVTPFGTTVGDNDIEVNEWTWSIQVLRLALVSFVGADDPASPGLCDSTTQPAERCKPWGMDEVLDCRYCTFSEDPEIAACCSQGDC